MATTGSMEISALGRPLNLGTLYDARNDHLVPGISLWSNDDITKYTRVSKKNQTTFSVKASETLSEKMNMLDVSASVKASFLCGLVEVGGSAKYLKQEISSSAQCSMTLKFSQTTVHKELNVSELKILDPVAINKTGATHVVVEVTYGADAFLEFRETASSEAKKQEIQGKLNVMVNKIPKFSLKGEGSVSLNTEDKEKVKNFSCKFYGDFHLRELPATYEDAIKVYKELPSLLGKEGNDAVPMTVWLYPLSKLTNTEYKLETISAVLETELEDTMNDFQEARVKSNSLLERSRDIKAEDIVAKLKMFQSSLRNYTTNFKRKMAELIPEIRGGAIPETFLRDFLQKKDQMSGLTGKEMKKWLGGKDTEISLITQYIKKIQNFRIEREGHELDSFLSSPDASDCYVFCFTSVKYKEDYLRVITTKHAWRICALEQEPWYKRSEAIEALNKSLDIFKQTPTNCRVISFIEDHRYLGATVRWYQNTTLKDPNVTCVMKNPNVTCAMEQYDVQEFLRLDENTANIYIALSVDKKTATYVNKAQPYGNNPQRFDYEYSVLCAKPLSASRSYWECKWSGEEYVCIGVAYKSMHRKGTNAWVGGNHKSWSLYCKYNYYYAYHDYTRTDIPSPPPGTRKVGVYLDRPAGTLAFYIIESGEGPKKTWYTFKNIRFTKEDLYAGFWLGSGCSVSLDL